MGVRGPIGIILLNLFYLALEIGHEPYYLDFYMFSIYFW